MDIQFITSIASNRLLPSALRFFGAVTAASSAFRLRWPSSMKARENSINSG